MLLPAITWQNIFHRCIVIDFCFALIFVIGFYRVKTRFLIKIRFNVNFSLCTKAKELHSKYRSLPCKMKVLEHIFFFFFFFWNIWDIWKRQSSCFQIMQTWKYKTSIISMNWIEIFIKSYSLVHKKKKKFFCLYWKVASGTRCKTQEALKIDITFRNLD